MAMVFELMSWLNREMNDVRASWEVTIKCMTEEIAAEASLSHVRDAREFSKPNSKINLDGRTDRQTDTKKQSSSDTFCK